MGWQPEDLTPQVDGAQTLFATSYHRVIGQAVLFYNGEKVSPAQFHEPTSYQIQTYFTPSVGSQLFVVYWTDQTFAGRVKGYAYDPTGDPGANPPALEDTLEALGEEIDEVAGRIPQDPKNTARAASVVPLGGSYDPVGGATYRGRLTGMPNTVDGVLLVGGDRVLVKNQTDATQNGIWVVTSLGTGVDGVWDRAPDFDEDAEVTSGARLNVTLGLTNKETAWVLTSDDPITIGGFAGSALTWGRVGGGVISASGGGWAMVTDIAPNGGGAVGGKTYQTAANDVLQACITSTLDLLVSIQASGPRVLVNGSIVDLSRISGESHYAGVAVVTLAGSGLITVKQVMPDNSEGAAAIVSVTYQPAPTILTCTFVGGYPGSQTELKAGDTFQLSGTVDQVATNVEILDYGAMANVVIAVSGTAFTITGMIANRGTTTQDLPARVRAQNVYGAWSSTFDTNSAGSVDGTHTVKLNNTYPSIVFGSITYPGIQAALKGSEIALVSVSTSDLDSIAYDSPTGELSITNPTIDEASKTVQRASGGYNISTPNMRATANRSANNATTISQTVVKIANDAVRIDVTLPAIRLRSGGNDGTSAQNHTITIVANQQLLAAPIMNAAPGGGTLLGSWSGGPTNWTRSLQVHDNNTKGTYSWTGLVATNLAGVVTNTITTGAQYTLGGFVARDVTFAAFSQSAQITVSVIDYSKLQAGKFTATNQQSIRNAIQGNQSNLVNTFTVLGIGVSPTTVWWNDVAAAASNSSGTAKLLALEEVA